MANYTPEQEVALTEAAPVTYADAVAFGEEFGKSTRSVIAKVMSLDLEYVRKPEAPKRPKGETKVELVARVEDGLHVKQGVLNGLEKATAQALAALLYEMGLDNS